MTVTHQKSSCVFICFMCIVNQLWHLHSKYYWHFWLLAETTSCFSLFSLTNHPYAHRILYMYHDRTFFQNLEIHPSISTNCRQCHCFPRSSRLKVHHLLLPVPLHLNPCTTIPHEMNTWAGYKIKSSPNAAVFKLLEACFSAEVLGVWSIGRDPHQ